MADSLFVIDTADRRRIESKLERIRANLVSEEGPILKLFIKLADSYCNTIASGMGTIESSGSGYAYGTLTSPFLGDSVTVKWKDLTERTIAKKSEDGLQLTTAIWMNTGDTKKAVKPWVKVFKHTATVFGGIDASTNPESARRAMVVETGAGGAFSERALFTTVNEIFIDHYSDIMDGVQAAVRQTIADAGWGA